jgi:hypothetical protein
LSFVSSSTSESSSSESASSSEAASESNPAALTIEISPAFYDSSCIEGPATGLPASPTRYVAFPNKGGIDEHNSRVCSPEWAPTAPFIHPYDPFCDEDYDAAREMTPEERQRLGPFDFDLLPSKQGHTLQNQRISGTATAAPRRQMSIVEAFDVMSALKLPGRKLGQVQEKCNENQRPISHIAEKPLSRSDCTAKPVQPRVDPSTEFKFIRAVPAFASPFTRILEPVVTRAQWEIVMRSMFLAGMISWTIVGCLLSVPVHR